MFIFIIAYVNFDVDNESFKVHLMIMKITCLKKLLNAKFATIPYLSWVSKFLCELDHPACLLQCCANWQKAYLVQLFPPIYENINLIPGLSLFSASVKIIMVFRKIKHCQSLCFIINPCSVILQVYLSHPG